MFKRSAIVAILLGILGVYPPLALCQLPNIPLPPGVDSRPLSERIGDGSKGVILVPRGGDSLSGLASVTPPTIDPDTGRIYSGSGTADNRGSVVAGHQARLEKVPGQGYRWVSTYKNSYGGPPRAVWASDRIQRQKADEERRAAKMELQQAADDMNFRIDEQGRAYANNSYLGTARRVVNNQTGRKAWRYDIPSGWTLIRYDGETNTSRHKFKQKKAVEGDGIGFARSVSMDANAGRMAGAIEQLAGDYANFMEGQQHLPEARQVLAEARALQRAAGQTRVARSRADAVAYAQQVALAWRQLSARLQRLGAINGTQARKLLPINSMAAELQGSLQ